MPDDLKPFGEDAAFVHLGFAVPSIEAVFPGLASVPDPLQNVRVAFTVLQGIAVELVEPLGEESPVSQMLKKGQRLYHVCYEVSDLDEAIRRARDHGFRCIATPVPAVAFDQRRIAWLYHRSLGLFELLERSPG